MLLWMSASRLYARIDYRKFGYRFQTRRLSNAPIKLYETETEKNYVYHVLQAIDLGTCAQLLRPYKPETQHSMG